MRETHGKSNTRLYKIWIGMKGRCYNPNKDSYTNYGAKGITVCDEWLNSFKSFQDWAEANGYSDTLSIDRIDNAGNYEPDNCRWETALVQSSNTRILYSHNKSGFRGVSWNSSSSLWEVSISINSSTVKVGYYSDILQAAKAYDTYIRDNNLPHTPNGVLNIDERVDSNIGQILIKTNTSGFRGVTSPKRIQHMKNPWVGSVIVGKEKVWSKYFSNPEEAAYFRDKYIRDNDLSNKLNFSDTEFNSLGEIYAAN